MRFTPKRAIGWSGKHQHFFPPRHVCFEWIFLNPSAAMHFASNQKLPVLDGSKNLGKNDYLMLGWTSFLLNQSSLCHCVRFTPHRPCIKTTKTRSFLEHQIQVEKINRMGRDFEGDTWNKSLVLISAGFFFARRKGVESLWSLTNPQWSVFKANFSKMKSMNSLPNTFISYI